MCSECIGLCTSKKGSSLPTSKAQYLPICSMRQTNSCELRHWDPSETHTAVRAVLHPWTWPWEGNWESWEKNEFLLFDYLIKQVNTMFFRHLHKRTNLDWWFFLKSPCVLMRGENNVFKQKLIWEDSKCFCWWIETEGTLFIVFDNRFRWQYAFTVKLKNWNETQIISSRHAGVY